MTKSYTVNLSFYLIYYSMCVCLPTCAHMHIHVGGVCMCLCAHMCMHVHLRVGDCMCTHRWVHVLTSLNLFGGQRTAFRSHLSPSTMSSKEQPTQVIGLCVKCLLRDLASPCTIHLLKMRFYSMCSQQALKKFSLGCDLKHTSGSILREHARWTPKPDGRSQ